MFSWLYPILLTAAAIVYLPKLLYDIAFKKKYRHSLLQRLGIGLPSLPRGPVIWLHAVSMGETRAAAPLARLLSEKHPGYQLIVSSVTETGHAEARRLLPTAAAHLFLPFDLPWLLKPLLAAVDIKMVIFSESDLWPGFMALCRSKGASLVLVNGKLSERSLRRFLWCPPLRRQITGLLDLCCVQNSIYASRFQQLGVASDLLKITGNLKFDISNGEEGGSTLPFPLPLSPASPLVVAGSTHRGEEKAIIEALAPLWKTVPDLRVVIVPRHPDRFDEVWDLLQQQPEPALRYSQSNKQQETKEWRLLLFDTMGLLPTLYPHASVAIVGGSFVTDVGGHNIIEPCLAGTPVLFGPSMYTQEEMVDLVTTYKAGLQVKNTSQLTTTLQEWLTAPSQLCQLRRQCILLKHTVRGSTADTYHHLSALLTRSSCLQTSSYT